MYFYPALLYYKNMECFNVPVYFHSVSLNSLFAYFNFLCSCSVSLAVDNLNGLEMADCF